MSPELLYTLAVAGLCKQALETPPGAEQALETPPGMAQGLQTEQADQAAAQENAAQGSSQRQISRGLADVGKQVQETYNQAKQVKKIQGPIGQLAGVLSPRSAPTQQIPGAPVLPRPMTTLG